MGWVYSSLFANAAGTFGPIRPLTDTEQPGVKAFQIGQNPGSQVISLGVQGVLSNDANFTWTVNVSLDPPNALANWLALSNLSGQTTSQYQPILYPISALQLVIANYSAGSMVLGVVQWP